MHVRRPLLLWCRPRGAVRASRSAVLLQLSAGERPSSDRVWAPAPGPRCPGRASRASERCRGRRRAERGDAAGRAQCVVHVHGPGRPEEDRFPVRRGRPPPAGRGPCRGERPAPDCHGQARASAKMVHLASDGHRLTAIAPKVFGTVFGTWNSSGLLSRTSARGAVLLSGCTGVVAGSVTTGCCAARRPVRSGP